MAKLPGLQDVTSDLLIANPQVNVNIDRDKASALGVTAEQIEDALYTAYGQRQISTIYAPNDEYWVIMELRGQIPERSRGSFDALYSLEQRHAGSVERSGQSDVQPWAAHRESLRPASRGDDFFQSSERHRDRRRREFSEAPGARRTASHGDRTISGNRESV